MKKTVQLLLIAALTLSLSLNGMTALAEDSSAPETSSAVTVETKDGQTEGTKDTEQKESGQKETSSEQTTSETSSSSQSQESSKAEESSQTTANSGTYENVTWEINPKAKTLTLTKNTDNPSTNIVAEWYEQFPLVRTGKRVL